MSGYLNLCDNLRLIFRQLRMTFHIKIIISCRTHQTLGWQHKHTHAFQHITKSSSAAGCTRRQLLISAMSAADLLCLRPTADEDFVISKCKNDKF